MVKPQDLEVPFNAELKRIAETLEQIFDDALTRNYMGPHQKITFQKPTNVKQHILDFVCAKYHEHWKVELISDQRDGDYLEFTPLPAQDWHGH